MKPKTWSIRLDHSLPRTARIIVQADADERRISMYPQGGYAPAMPSLTPDVACKIANRLVRAAGWIDARQRQR